MLERGPEMTQMIWQATHHAHAGETTPPGIDVVPFEGEPIAVRPSPDLDRLLASIRAHEIEEIDAVAAYEGLARETADPVIRGLLRMLVEDEEHHHRVFRAMAMSLRAVATSASREINLPPRGVPTTAVEPLRKYAKQERETVDKLRALADQAPDLFGGLFALLLQLVALDGEKHELILRFVVKELEAARDIEGRSAS
jgi:Mn-containing catalase